jgi:hypothetical protein
LSADVDGSFRYQLARAYQATGQADLARTALEDYEAFRKGPEAGSDTLAKPPSTTPPE